MVPNTASELVGVEHPASRSRGTFPRQLVAQGVKLLHLLRDEPDDRVRVCAQLQDRLPSILHLELFDHPRWPRLLVEDTTLVSPAPGVVNYQDHLGPRRHHPRYALQVVHHPPPAVDFPLSFLAHDLFERITLDQRVRLVASPLCLPHPPG